MPTSRPAHFLGLSIVTASVLVLPVMAGAFEGRISAELTRGGETNALQYTASADHLRIANTRTDWPHPVNIVDLKSNAVTLVFLHNRSFVRLKQSTHETSARPSGIPEMPAWSPSGIGSQMSSAAPIGPTNLPGTPAPPPMPQMPAMPQMSGDIPAGIGPQSGVRPQPSTLPPFQPSIPSMPPMMAENLELKATGETTNLLGYACARYELKQRGETMQIWATDKLLPFQPYLQNQPARFGPRRIEEQWPEMLKANGLFPMLAVLKFDHGPERLRFEVKSVKEEKVTDPDGKLFQPPKDYHALGPLPF